MGFFTGADDALQEALIEQERKRRQDMLDAIAAEDRKAKHENERTGRDIQREQIAESRANREATAGAARQGAADKFENSTAMGTELDDAGTGILDAAGRGSHVTRTAPSASLRVTNGLAAPTADNPLGLDTSTAPGAKLVEGKRIFAGTAKQQEDKQKQDTRSAYVKSLPVGPQRSFLEAQDATGDSSLPAAIFTPPKPVKPTYHSVPGVGLFSVGEDGQPKLLVPAKDKPTKPGAPAVYHDADGVEHLMQVGADGKAVEIPLPAGMVKGAAPKHVKTPAEIETEATARARGTAAGKKDVTGGGGLFDTIGSLWSAAHGKTAVVAPTGPVAAPKAGDTKKFPNGSVGVFDGTGWVKQ